MDGLLLYRRADVQHDRFYARISLPRRRKYKVVALNAGSLALATQEATKRFYEAQYALENNMALFQRSFAQVAKEYLDAEKIRSGLSGKGGITLHRWRVMDNHVKVQLSRYVGKKHISQIGQKEWAGYAVWRQKNGKGRDGGLVSSGTIRAEMTTLRAIMRFAALHGYISEIKMRDAFSGKYLAENEKRDAFTRDEYRTLYRFMRQWVREKHAGINEMNRWTRQMVRNFILIMCHTGMRNSEARNLRWRDIFFDQDRNRVIFSVYGKKKRRTFEASGRVQVYLDRIREISGATKATDYVFSTYKGDQSRTLYVRTIADLLKAAGVVVSSSGKRRSTYSFRHSYATWRLQAGAGVYQLAQQMGTSPAMIQYHYGHVMQRDVADNVLQGLR
jgi:integrase